MRSRIRAHTPGWERRGLRVIAVNRRSSAVGPCRRVSLRLTLSFSTNPSRKGNSMIRRLLTLLPLAAAAVLAMSAVPAHAAKPAQKPVNGKMDLTLNLVPCDDGRFLSGRVPSSSTA